MTETAAAAAPTRAPKAEEHREPVLPQLSPELMKTTRLYELVMLFDPAEASRSWDRLSGWITDLIKVRYGQHVLRIDRWADARKLAYEIKGLKRATYMLVWFRSAPDKLAELERDLRLDEQIARFMITVHDEEPPTVGMMADDFDQAAPRREDDEMRDD